MVKKVRADANLRELAERVRDQGDRYLIEEEGGSGEEMAAVVPVWILKNYERARDEFFALIREAQQRNKNVDPEEVERLVTEAVRAVRAQRSR